MSIIYRNIQQIIGPLIFLKNEHQVQYGEIVKIESEGKGRTGQVVKMNEDLIVIEVFQDTKGLSSENSKIFFTEDTFKLRISESDMFGRTFNSLGKPIDILTKKVLKAEMITDLEENGHGIKTIIVEKLDRVARDLMIQETIIQDFRENGVQLISALEGADLLDNDPTRKLVRQILGAIAEYEKSMLVQKLRVARQRKKAKTGKCEGRKPYKEAAPDTVAYIRKLRRKPKGMGRKTFREIADQLNLEGVQTLNGQKWNLQTVRHALS